MAVLADNDEVAADRGAQLGHRPPDNKGHQRSASDTPILLFIWRNGRCQSLLLDWFFPDTEVERLARP
jgi:hypothetical protein